MNDDSQALISLADFIQQIKQDLAENQVEDPVFYIDGIEIEAQVVASKEENGNAGLKLSILNFAVNAGVASKSSQVQTQTLKISLSPIMSKEELKDKLSDEDMEKVTEKTRNTVFRGASNTTTEDHPNANTRGGRSPLRGGGRI